MPSNFRYRPMVFFAHYSTLHTDFHVVSVVHPPVQLGLCTPDIHIYNNVMISKDTYEITNDIADPLKFHKIKTYIVQGWSK